jgi:hypothetical protein
MADGWKLLLLSGTHFHFVSVLSAVYVDEIAHPPPPPPQPFGYNNISNPLPLLILIIVVVASMMPIS